jgi:hypothetical protein
MSGAESLTPLMLVVLDTPCHSGALHAHKSDAGRLGLWLRGFYYIVPNLLKHKVAEDKSTPAHRMLS